VGKYGPKQWSLIAQEMHADQNNDNLARTGKQCRERWHNHLDPSIKKSVWTREEDKILIDAHLQRQVCVCVCVWVWVWQATI
jgi:myb proto-oncogene protein